MFLRGNKRTRKKAKGKNQLHPQQEVKPNSAGAFKD